ncbi:hypothetical protein DSM112329_02993 [Paraconexibacter sp. AEG42_29]|uniref:SRPBCC family protein n=1 Tax=Paraconexibacter sp. AEG42_29 TaxID=2997339 RepID=A0AAU7AWX2_9ACTN
MRLVVKRTIHAAGEPVFDWLADSSNYTVAPVLLRERRVRDGEAAPYGVGAIREMLATGAWFREEITTYDRPRTIGYLIIRSYPRLLHRGGTIQITPVGDAVDVVWTSEYTVARAWGGRLTALLFKPVLIWSFTRILRGAERATAGRA